MHRAAQAGRQAATGRADGDGWGILANRETTLLRGRLAMAGARIRQGSRDERVVHADMQ